MSHSATPTASLYAARRDSDDRRSWLSAIVFRRSRGFTIVEMLAALLVMAVGIIGIAALYSDQVQTNPEAQLHREAAELAEQIADRIRNTKEGHAGFATTIGVLCDQQSKLSCRRTSPRARRRVGRMKSSASCRADSARSRATRSRARRRM